jgi:oligoendopeptidase F
MTQTSIPTRDQIDPKYKWNAESVFADSEEVEQTFKSLPGLIEEMARYKGRLHESPLVLLNAFKQAEEVLKPAQRLTMYTNMAYNVNTHDQQAAKAVSRAGSLFGMAMASTSFMRPELLAIGRETLDSWMQDTPELQIYAHFVDDLFRQHQHTRSSEVEELLSMLSDPFRNTYTTYQSLTDADFQFEPARSFSGEEIPFTGSTIHRLLTNPDREIRRTAWENYTWVYLDFKNTLTSNLASTVKQDVFMARARRHVSSLEAALFGPNIPVEVYHNLIDTFRQNLPIWKRYWAARRKALGVETLYPYDTWAPLSTNQPRVSYEQAVDWITESMRPLGDEYAERLRRGCLEERWVDVYPNQGKTAGAFSSGAPDTFPFIKMSYDDTVFSMSTLAHELGHSMHSYLTRQNQPIIYSRYTLFLAEVASNFNQAMVRAYLFENNHDPAFQISLIEEAMSNFHRYFFQMPTLARFELETHQRIEKGIGFSADDLIDIMADLFEEAYGGEMAVDRPRVGITWATFLHMYMNFYVYAYATGIAGAHALANRILSGEPGAAEAYLTFLKSGGSRYSLDILKDAGVDLTTPAPVEAAFQVMAGYVDRLEKLTANREQT